MHKFVEKASKTVKGSFGRFVLSYVSVLMIPIGLVYCIYFFSSEIIEKEVNRSTSSMLEQARQVIDARLKEVDDLAVQLSWNTRIQRLMYSTRPLSAAEKYEAFEVSKELRNYKISNHFIRDFYIYFKNSDFIINSQSRYDVNFFYNYISSYKNMEFGQWHDEMLGSYHYKKYFQALPVVYDNTVQSTVTYVQSLPFGENSLWNGTLVVLINEDDIKSLLKNLGNSEDYLSYIITPDNRIIAREGKNSFIRPIPYEELADAKGFVNTKTDGSNRVIAHTSTANGWKLVSIAPMDLHMAEVLRLKNITLKLTLALLLMGVVIAYLLYRSYLPAKDLLNMVARKLYQDIPAQKRKNYDTLKSVVEKAIEESTGFRTQIPTLKAGFLEKLIKGNIRDPEEINGYMKLLDIQFKHPEFSIILMRLSGAPENSSAHSRSILQFIEKLVLDPDSGAAFRNVNLYAFPLEDDKIAVICNFETERERDGCEALDRIAGKITGEFYDGRDTAVTVAVSSVCPALKDIHACYQQAALALNYSLIKGKNTVIRYNDILPSEDKQNCYYSLQTETCLINRVRAGDYAEVNRLLEEIYDANFVKGQLSPAIVRCLMFDMMSTAIKCLQDINMDWKKSFQQEVDPISRLSKCETVEEMYVALRLIYSKLCEHMNVNKKSHNTRLKEGITEYIRENYHNKDLCLNRIAAEFDLAPAYLSYFFKEQTGENLIDFLNKIRLEKAMMLLEGRNELLVSKVADQVGFTNVSALIRSFKKYKGMTPTEYREQCSI